MNLLHAIALETGLGVPDVERIISTAPARYKQYPIPKRDGGFRLIAQPSRELKLLQRFLLDEWLSSLPVHPSATAYTKNKNIRENADRHKDNSAILKLDFRNFFPSIRASDWRQFCNKHPLPWDGDGDAQRVLKILFWGLTTTRPICLSIGAPTSPLISNVMMFDLDSDFDGEAKARNLVYTRYADDITVSGASIEDVILLEKHIRQSIGNCRSPKLKVNERKRGIYTTGQRRMVTGIILTPQRNISIGRQRKRTISALIHRFSLRQLDIEQIGYLKGMLGFAIANEPSVLNRARKKYGNAIVDQILHTQIPRRADR